MSKTSIICTLLLLLISTENFSQSQKAKRLHDEFIQVAFQQIGNQQFSVAKWENKDTLKYFLEGEITKFPKKSWSKYTNEISGLTGITIVETQEPTEANIHIYFGEFKDYFEKYNLLYAGSTILVNQNSDSWIWRSYNRMRQLTKANFCIVNSKVKNDLRREYLLKSLFLRSLGMLGIIESRKSLLNPRNAEQFVDLFDNDKKLIKLFYSPNIKAGMILSEVENALNEMDLEALAAAKL